MCKAIIATEPLARQFQEQIAGLWPALKGSLAQIHKPCIRKHCPACARGDKHAAWILSCTDGTGRRRSLYVPESLVPCLRQGLANGRKMEKLLSRMGPALIKAYRSQRDKPQRSDPPTKKS